MYDAVVRVYRLGIYMHFSRQRAALVLNKLCVAGVSGSSGGVKLVSGGGHPHYAASPALKSRRESSAAAMRLKHIPPLTAGWRPRLTQMPPLRAGVVSVGASSHPR